MIGTPYFVSPEVCRGLPYDAKSDIWSLGCILYELATLKQPFSAENLPALVRNIMQAKVEPLPRSCGPALQSLLNRLLCREACSRPLCGEILALDVLADVVVPVRKSSRRHAAYAAHPQSRHDHETTSINCATPLNGNLSQCSSQDHGCSPATTTSTSSSTESSVFYWRAADAWPSQVRFGRGFQIVQVACGERHYLALNAERQVFAWGDNSFGQTGLGQVAEVAQPQLLSELASRAIVQIAAGGHLSAFLSETGLLSTCGSNLGGALGHGQVDDTALCHSPRLVEALLSAEIIHVAVGTTHMLAVSSDSGVFSWGDGSEGQLGLGEGMLRTATPHPVQLPSATLRVERAYATSDASLLLTSTGRLLACGNNRYNKLGLNARFGILGRGLVDKSDRFGLVKLMGKGEVVDAAVGSDVTCVIMDSGKSYTLGYNGAGALGVGHVKACSAPAAIKWPLQNYSADMCAVGDGFVLLVARQTSASVKLPEVEGSVVSSTWAEDKGLAVPGTGSVAKVSTSTSTFTKTPSTVAASAAAAAVAAVSSVFNLRTSYAANSLDSNQGSAASNNVVDAEGPIRHDLFAWGGGFLGLNLAEMTPAEVSAFAEPSKVCFQSGHVAANQGDIGVHLVGSASLSSVGSQLINAVAVSGQSIVLAVDLETGRAGSASGASVGGAALCADVKEINTAEARSKADTRGDETTDALPAWLQAELGATVIPVGDGDSDKEARPTEDAAANSQPDQSVFENRPMVDYKLQDCSHEEVIENETDVDAISLAEVQTTHDIVALRQKGATLSRHQRRGSTEHVITFQTARTLAVNLRPSNL